MIKNTCTSRCQVIKYIFFIRKIQFTKNEVFLIVFFHISGVVTAAFDFQLEWLIVKGIADFVGAEQVNAESWQAFASTMAASLVSHILSDPGYFRSCPHYRGMHFLSV